MAQHRASGHVVAAVLLLCVSFLFPVSAHGAFTVEWQDGTLTVIAEDASLSEVLREVARRTGLQIDGVERMRESVTLRFAALPLHDALGRLLAHKSYAIVEESTAQGEPRPVRVLLALPGAASPAPDDGAAPEGVAALEQDPDERIAALRSLPVEADEKAFHEAMRDRDQVVRATAFQTLAERGGGAVALLEDATRSEQPEIRLQALQLLRDTAGADDGIAGRALREALTDDAVTVKHYAIQALARRGGSDAVDLLRRTFHDADPSIKIMILESVAQRDHGAVFLEEAASEHDETVRSFATFWLERRHSRGR